MIVDAPFLAYRITETPETPITAYCLLLTAHCLLLTAYLQFVRRRLVSGWIPKGRAEPDCDESGLNLRPMHRQAIHFAGRYL